MQRWGPRRCSPHRGGQTTSRCGRGGTRTSKIASCWHTRRPRWSFRGGIKGIKARWRRLVRVTVDRSIAFLGPWILPPSHAALPEGCLNSYSNSKSYFFILYSPTLNRGLRSSSDYLLFLQLTGSSSVKASLRSGTRVSLI